MDQGPVDAGPMSGNEYDAPGSRPDSPKRRRPEPRTSSGFRNASNQRPNAVPILRRTPTTNQDEVRRVRSHLRRQSGDSNDSYSDEPAYPKVGATSEEVNGEVCVDDNDPHLRIDDVEVHDDAEEPKVTEDDERRLKMVKFTLYETSVRYWITGCDMAEKDFRLLRVDRNSAPGKIQLYEDETVYDRKHLNEVLANLDEGNRATGGLRKKCSFWGLLGFIRFTEAYYMLIITKRQQVAMIGGHYVYQIDDTELVPLTTGSSSLFASNRNPEEARFLATLNNVDLTKSFYFSYSYDITRTLQHNIIRQREALADGKREASADFNAMFVWNHHLLKPAMIALKNPSDWCLPIIHGYIDQAPLDIFGKCIYVTIIGRRSRFFAGARFLKRGVNDNGYVANDVETEQIVSEKLTTSFHAPGPRLYANPAYTSYVQHRGSIPLYWVQEMTTGTPKPDIQVNLLDPFYQPAALHFDNLFERYGCPVYCLNLIKARERTPRESKLLPEFENCIKYLNQSLPADKKIHYRGYDMARASKSRTNDVMAELGDIAREIVGRTGFFHNGEEGHNEPKIQNGVARTNCIDCLDRTNSAQFVIGKHAFALQLQALGVYQYDELQYDTDATNLFTQMFHHHGDTIALQYGGSHLVNTVSTYRRRNVWHDASRDMLENMKRYYNNSFVDKDRQEAYNLFLGNYIWSQGQPMLWDLTTDYYLHHSDPKAWLERNRRSYIYWFTREFLEPRVLPALAHHSPSRKDLQSIKVADYDMYWQECYRPGVISSLAKIYSYRITVESRYLPESRGSGHQRDVKHDFSPFTIRLDHRPDSSHDSPDKRPARKAVTIMAPHDDTSRSSSRAAGEKSNHRALGSEEVPSILRHGSTLPPNVRGSLTATAVTGLGLGVSTLGANAPPNTPAPISSAKPPADKDQKHLWTLNQFHFQSLNPSVSPTETREYERYITHPLTLPLVTSTDLPSDADIDYLEYVHKAGGSGFNSYNSPLVTETSAASGEPRVDAARYHSMASISDTVDGTSGFQDIDELLATTDADMDAFEEYFAVAAEPLTVTEQDGAKKRYKAYRQWLRGKSLFKQSKVDPEYVAVGG